MLSSEIFPKYACMTSTILCRNSNTMAAFTFCFVTAATQMLERLIWKKLVRAMLVTGERTCCRAWMTLTRNASTAFRLKLKGLLKIYHAILCRELIMESDKHIYKLRKTILKLHFKQFILNLYIYSYQCKLC